MPLTQTNRKRKIMTIETITTNATFRNYLRTNGVFDVATDIENTAYGASWDAVERSWDRMLDHTESVGTDAEEGFLLNLAFELMLKGLRSEITLVDSGSIVSMENMLNAVLTGSRLYRTFGENSNAYWIRILDIASDTHQPMAVVDAIVSLWFRVSDTAFMDGDCWAL
jgi:hypothetical protein